MAAWETLGTDREQPAYIRDFARIWRAADKIVYSRTLEAASTARTRIEREFDPEAVRRMKAELDSDISIGGPTLAAYAIKARTGGRVLPVRRSGRGRRRTALPSRWSPARSRAARGAPVRERHGLLALRCERQVNLPIMPPVAPMLAKAVEDIPRGAYSYEPKWDGFRSIVFRDGDEVEIGSRNERPMTRYFPEVVAAIRSGLPERCVLDGEIVVPDPSRGRLDFEALQQRIHPAESRVRLLAAAYPRALRRVRPARPRRPRPHR